MNRRNFLKTSGTLVGSMMAASALGKTVSGAMASDRKKIRYAMVGCGHRGTGMWGKRLVDAGYKDYIDFVGLCDTNPGRLEYAKKAMQIPDCPTFGAEDFDRMIKETKPDVVMVTTPDATHSDYIIRALNLGVNVMTEKPMTTDEAKCQESSMHRKKRAKK